MMIVAKDSLPILLNVKVQREGLTFKKFCPKTPSDTDAVWETQFAIVLDQERFDKVYKYCP